MLQQFAGYEDDFKPEPNEIERKRARFSRKQGIRQLEKDKLEA